MSMMKSKRRPGAGVDPDGPACHEEGRSLVAASGLSPTELSKEAPIVMLHAGLDLSRKRLDFDLLAEDGSRVERGAVAPDADGLQGLARRLDR